MTRRAIVLAASLFATACGGSWSDEDIAFVRALPSRDQLVLHAPGDGEGALSSPLLGQSTTLTDVLRTTNEVNAFVGALTGGLDLVRTIPPSDRADDSRTWGPYPDDSHAGVEWRIVIVREAPAAYRYELAQQRDSAGFVTTVVGHFHGESASHGTGDLAYDAQKGRALGLEDDEKLATLGLEWDRTTGDALATMHVTSTADADATIRYTVRADGGELTYDITANLDFTATPAREAVQVVARWLATGAGRADSKVSGGDLGEVVGTSVECWNDASMQVYTHRNFECGGAPECAEGDVTACAFSDLP